MILCFVVVVFCFFFHWKQVLTFYAKFWIKKQAMSKCYHNTWPPYNKRSTSLCNVDPIFSYNIYIYLKRGYAGYRWIYRFVSFFKYFVMSFNLLIEKFMYARLMSTSSICFRGEIRKKSTNNGSKKCFILRMFSWCLERLLTRWAGTQHFPQYCMWAQHRHNSACAFTQFDLSFLRAFCWSLRIQTVFTRTTKTGQPAWIHRSIWIFAVRPCNLVRICLFQGDRGGPLGCYAENGEYTQIGISSFGAGTRCMNNPQIFTRVSKFVNWIEANKA